jgi:DNA-binding NarL/FixJ family response regulator
MSTRTIARPEYPQPLTKRELEVVALLALGKSSKEVATALGVATKTIETHRVNLYRKACFTSVTDTVHYALSRGLIANKFGSAEFWGS